MEELKRDINTISESSRAYIESEANLLKLKAVKELSTAAASVFSRFMISLLGLITYLFAVMALGFFLNAYFESTWIGLTLSAAVALLVFAASWWLRKTFIEYPIQNAIIKNLIKRLSI